LSDAANKETFYRHTDRCKDSMPAAEQNRQWLNGVTHAYYGQLSLVPGPTITQNSPFPLEVAESRDHRQYSLRNAPTHGGMTKLSRHGGLVKHQDGRPIPANGHSTNRARRRATTLISANALVALPNLHLHVVRRMHFRTVCLSHLY